MSTQVVADRYAEAIFALAQDNGAAEAVDNELASVVELLKSNHDLHRLWMHPVVDTADKQAMIRQIFSGKVQPMTLNFLLFLFDKKRGMLIEQVQKAYRNRFNATRRRATVTVTSAHPLDEGTTSELRQLLSKRLDKEVQMDTAVDPALIGGMVLRVEDQVIDNSIRGRLEALRYSLS